MPEKSPQQSFSSDEAWQLILQTLKSLNDKPALNEHKKTIIAEAVAALKDLTKAEKYPRYAEFLHRTLHDAGGGGVLVCAVALGQTRVVRMRNKERVSLLGKIKENPRIFGDSNITLLVVHHGVPRSMKELLDVARQSHETRQSRVVPATNSAVESRDLDIRPHPLPSSHLPTDVQTKAPQSYPSGHLSQDVNPILGMPMSDVNQLVDAALVQPRLEPGKNPRELYLAGEGRFFVFTMTLRSNINNLPEPLRDGVQLSNLWQEEMNTGGLPITRTVGAFLPVTEEGIFDDKRDSFFLARLGFHTVFAMMESTGLGAGMEAINTS